MDTWLWVLGVIAVLGAPVTIIGAIRVMERSDQRRSILRPMIGLMIGLAMVFGGIGGMVHLHNIWYAPVCKTKGC